MQVWTPTEPLTDAEFQRYFGDCIAVGRAVAELIYSWELDHKLAVLAAIFQRRTMVRNPTWLDWQILRGSPQMAPEHLAAALPSVSHLTMLQVLASCTSYPGTWRALGPPPCV